MNKKIIVITIALFLIFSFFSYFDSFQNIENKLKDYFLQKSNIAMEWGSLFSKEVKKDKDIIIIGIDDRSLKALGKWPWSRTQHAKLLNIISEGKPAAIGIDIMFSEKSSNEQDDVVLAKAIKDSNCTVLPEYATFNEKTRAKNMMAITLEKPITGLAKSASIGSINVIQEEDGIVRKELCNFKFQNENVNSFDYEIYKQYLKSKNLDIKTVAVQKDEWNRRYIDFSSPNNKFTYMSYVDVINGNFFPEYFEGKIVLIGPYTVGISDYYYIPTDYQTQTYGVSIHANIIQNYLEQNFKHFADYNIKFLTLLIFSMLGLILFKIKKPFVRFSYVIAIMYSYLFGIGKAYSSGYIMDVLYPLGIFVVIYLISWVYTYIKEMRERKRITSIFGRYVAPQVVNEIIKGGDDSIQLGGVKREVTALFVDIRGFTPMSEKVQPEDVVQILNDYLELCEVSVFKFGGTLDKFIGDAAMAIFNAPLDLKDHALMAVKAAYNMKVGSEILYKKLQEKFGVGVEFGIGINTGYAVVGNIGSKNRMDYTAIGDTINTAARLESNAKRGQILISKSTYDLVEDKIIAKDLGSIKVKGKDVEIKIYEVEGLVEEYETKKSN